jgi:ribosomal protein S18 acetylase RimI-like enzyme
MDQGSIRHPIEQDIDRIVEIYISCFPDRVLDVFGGEHHRLFIRDYLRLYLAFDPSNAWVYVCDDGAVVGVAIAPCRYSSLRAAFAKGQCFICFWHLLTGRYGFPASVLKLFLKSGFSFSSDKAIQGLWGKPYLHLLAVSPRYQGKKIGTQLMQWTLDHVRKQGVKECWAVVQKDNQRALGFYKSFGFRTYTRLKNGDLVIIWENPHAALCYRER